MNEMQEKFSRLMRWQAGETPGPWGMSLFPTNRCNQRCKMCWQRWAEAEFGKLDFSEVPDDRWLALVDEAAELEVREWSISGGGEPLTRADLIMALCEKICARGMKGHLHTNATLLEPEHLEHLARIGWEWLNFSLDGPDAETNDGLRSEGAFERATRNIRRLGEIKRRLAVDKPMVVMNPVITRTNCDRIDRMVHLAHDLGCGAIFVSSLIVHNDDSAAFQLNAEQQAALPDHLRRAADAADALELHHNIRTLLPDAETGPEAASYRPAADAGPAPASFAGDGRLADALCFEAWLSTAFTADGKTGACCVFWDEQADSIRDKSLRDVWLGPYLRELRRKLIARRGLPRYCSLCHSAVIARSEELRQMLLARERTHWRELGALRRVGLLSHRLASNLRNRGLRQTLRRAKEWMQIHKPY